MKAVFTSFHIVCVAYVVAALFATTTTTTTTLVAAAEAEEATNVIIDGATGSGSVSTSSASSTSSTKEETDELEATLEKRRRRKEERRERKRRRHEAKEEKKREETKGTEGGADVVDGGGGFFKPFLKNVRAKFEALVQKKKPQQPPKREKRGGRGQRQRKDEKQRGGEANKRGGRRRRHQGGGDDGGGGGGGVDEKGRGRGRRQNQKRGDDEVFPGADPDFLRDVMGTDSPKTGKNRRRRRGGGGKEEGTGGGGGAAAAGRGEGASREGRGGGGGGGRRRRGGAGGTLQRFGGTATVQSISQFMSTLRETADPNEPFIMDIGSYLKKKLLESDDDDDDDEPKGFMSLTTYLALRHKRQKKKSPPSMQWPPPPDPPSALYSRKVKFSSPVFDEFVEEGYDDGFGVEELIVDCYFSPFCAGVSYDSISSKDARMVMHAFLPNLDSPSSSTTKKKNTTDTEGTKDDNETTTEAETDEEKEAQSNSPWVSLRSPRTYVQHRGALVLVDDHDNNNEKDETNKGKSSAAALLLREASNITLDEARDMCDADDGCVAFTFPFDAFTGDLTGRVHTVLFASAVDGINYHTDDDDDSGGGVEWRTFVSNDPSYADRINATAIRFDWGVYKTPYPTSCCYNDKGDDGIGHDQSSRGTSSSSSRLMTSSLLPYTIDDVMRVDTTVQRIPCHNITRTEFESMYEATSTPVVLVGCDETWSGKERWALDSLVRRFDGSTRWRRSELWRNHSDVEEEEMATIAWSEVVHTISSSTDGGDGEERERRRFHIVDPMESDHAKSILNEYDVPGPFRGGDLFQPLRDAPGRQGGQFPRVHEEDEDGNYEGDGSSGYHWFDVGTEYTGIVPQVNPHGTDSWTALTHGHKWWIIFPEAWGDDEEALECNEDDNDLPAPARDWFANVGVNAALMEFGTENDRPIHILQKAGETLYVPHGRIYAVLNMDDTVAVTQYYGSPGNLQEVWKTAINGHRGGDLHRLYYAVLNKEQRRAIREGPYYDEYLEWDAFHEKF